MCTNYEFGLFAQTHRDITKIWDVTLTDLKVGAILAGAKIVAEEDQATMHHANQEASKQIYS